MIKILFVCLGNICRSPAAHAVMQQMIDAAGVSEKFFVDSAGTGDYHIGQLPDARMRRHGGKRGYRIDSRARQINRQDVDTFDMIITMDESNYANVKRLMSKQQLTKLHKLSDFSDIPGFIEVPDPYHGNAATFEAVIDLIEDACNGLLQRYIA